jgi:thioesterase domain-containing protein
VPTLFVAAREPLRAGEIRARWPRPCAHAKVDGDHFTMMSEHAEQITVVVTRWLDGLRADPE